MLFDWHNSTLSRENVSSFLVANLESVIDNIDMVLTYYVEDLIDWHRLIYTEHCWTFERDLIVTATRMRRDIKIPLCLSAPVRKTLI